MGVVDEAEGVYGVSTYGIDAEALVTVLRLKRPIYVLNYWYCNIHF